jgi:hypothetical protein
MPRLCPAFFGFRWSRCGSVCPLASLGLQVYPEGDQRQKHRHRWLDADLGNGITPGYRYEVKPSKVQPIRLLDIRLGLFYVGRACSQVSRKRGMGKFRSRNPDRFRPTWTPRSPTSLKRSGAAMTVCPYDKATFHRGRWPREGIVEEGAAF